MVKYQDETPWWVAHKAWSRDSPHLRSLELLRISAWKTGRGLGWLSLNEEGYIEQRTEEVLAHLAPWREKNMVGVDDDEIWDEWLKTSRVAIGDKAARTGLLGIEGVGYPVATAICCILSPDVWPVIDRWAVQTVFGLTAAGEPHPEHLWQRGIAYQAYARRLATAGAANWGSALTIHDLDIQAMSASQIRKGRRVGQLPAGWTPIPLS